MVPNPAEADVSQSKLYTTNMLGAIFLKYDTISELTCSHCVSEMIGLTMFKRPLQTSCIIMPAAFDLQGVCQVVSNQIMTLQLYQWLVCTQLLKPTGNMLW